VTWVEEEARRLCGPGLVMPGALEHAMECIRAGIEKAAEVAGERADFWAAHPRTPVPTVALDEAEACERAIRALLTPTVEAKP